MSLADDTLELRSQPRPSDADAVERILVSTGLFSAEEVVVARELIEDRIARGRESDYHWLLADDGPDPVGFACFGPIALTRSSWDLYWIAVEQELRGRGVGSHLLAAVGRAVGAAGGERLYIETSGRPDYADTRRFYERQGCELVARFSDFYAPGDDKIVFVQRIAGAPATAKPAPDISR